MHSSLMKFFGGLFLVVLSAGCGGNKGQDGGIVLGGDGGLSLDLGAVSYTDIQTQVFLAHCGNGGFGGRTCHLRQPPEGGLDLTAANSYAKLINVTAFIAPGLKRVQPGDPQHSFLWLKLTDKLTVTQGNPMPFQTGGKADLISSDLLALVEKWIYEGAPNN